MTTSTAKIPRAFVWRRLHSLMGLWLVVFLLEHLLTNSQAALWVGENGQGFVRMVNALHNLPYLQVIEAVLLGVPILIHLVWGVQYALQAKPNSTKGDGSKPSLPEYGRNRAYTWQRITSWILLVLLTFHVVKFRFLEYPDRVSEGSQIFYSIRVHEDAGLASIAQKLDVTLYKSTAAIPVAWTDVLAKKPLPQGEVVAVAKNFGTATLLAVRDVFQVPIYLVLYTIFVLAACFHAFNGLWTFLITWGWVLKSSAQRSASTICLIVMAVMAFLGLAAIWGTYWINLRM